MDLEKIADFIQKYAPQYTDREKIKEYVRLHLLYKTIFIGWDNNGDVSYICRWNFSPSGCIAHVTDLIIREDYRNHNIIKILLTQAYLMYPNLRYIKFRREMKYNGREEKVYSIAKILKRSK